MKDKYCWYFHPSDAEIEEYWSKGLLTVDANVLLDLYRYHESTRNALISALKSFNGRLWLSYQASEEFIRNRSGVIISSEKTFKQAKEEVEKLRSNYESTVTQLKGNRIIPDNVAEGLLKGIEPAIEEAKKAIDEVESSYPQFLKEDPILNDLAEMFSGSTGKSFTEEEEKEAEVEAQRRKDEEIPPGYMDKDKDGNRPYGDYFLWKQILSHSKETDKPLILVTSERKEDWWERHSGKTIGARPELLREAYEYCGRRILIYQTDRFLQYASKRTGNEVDKTAVEEIRAIDSLRSKFDHAVELVEQNIQVSSEQRQEGTLIVNLHRPVKNLTGSGVFDPLMIDIPTIHAELIENPENLPKIKLRAGTGTKFNFNLHIISGEYNVLLPVGQYVFKYVANCDVEVSMNDPDEKNTI